jgi:hypothetical protein
MEEKRVHLNIGFRVEDWRRLRDLAEERRSIGRASMAQIVRELVAAALAKREEGKGVQ